MEVRSRGAFASEFCFTTDEERKTPGLIPSDGAGGGTGSISITPGLQKIRKPKIRSVARMSGAKSGLDD
jgi:hypothetical protein